MTSFRLSTLGAFMLLTFSIGAIAASSSEDFRSDSAFLTKEVSKDDIDKADQVTKEEMEEISRKVDAMNDQQLSTVIDAVLPHQNRRFRRTLGTVRRCIEKVRCLFGGLKRQRQLKEAAAAAAAAAAADETSSDTGSRRKKRASSPAAILRAISKLTGLASSAANELGNRFGLGGLGSDFSLAGLFRDTQATASSAASSAVAADDPDVDLTEPEETNVADASEVVQETVCDQQCQLSVLVYRRLRRLLRRL